MNKLQIGDCEISYYIQKGRAKVGVRGYKITFSFNQRSELKITVSGKVTSELLASVLKKQQKWLLTNYQKKQAEIATLTHDYQDGDEYLLLGEKLQLHIVVSNHPKVILQRPDLFVYTRNLNGNTVRNLLEKYKEDIFTTVYTELLHQIFPAFANKISQYPMITQKHYQARWGSCYYKKNQIILNTNLIHVPQHLIAYVLQHELVHFIHPNHGDLFHVELAKHVGDEKRLKKELAKYSPKGI